MAEISGGELIVRCLAKEGVKWIFGITDSGYHPVMGAVKEFGIRWVAPRHEAAAAHMADGLFKTSGHIPVVMAGGGPGTANLLSGIICSMSEGVPVITITAQRRSQVVYPSRIGIYQALDQHDLFKPVTKWNAVVHSWNRIPEIVQMAFREATSGRPGPVQIDVPDDIMYEMGDEDSVRLLEPNQYRALQPEPSQRQIQEIARLIKEAQNPLLMPGTGVLNAGAWDDLLALADLLNCPVACSSAGNTALSHDHPCYLRPYGDAWIKARQEADVILAVGTSLGELDVPFDEYFGALHEQKIIHVDVEQKNIGANRPIFMGVVADAKATLSEIFTELKLTGVKPSNGEMIQKYREIEKEWWADEMQGYKDYDGDMIHPVQSILAARDIFSAEAINVSDGGNTALFNAIYIRLFKPRSSLGLFEFGHLGTGIPLAIGAKLANPDKEVFVITGDGAAGFNFMEMATAVRENTKITVIVHAEESWSMEEIAQVFTIGDVDNLVAVKQQPIRWDTMAEAMGCHGEFVQKPEELLDAFQRAKDSEKPAVVCVKIDKDANLVAPGGELFEQVYEGSSGE